jgi:hypothetical protein
VHALGSGEHLVRAAGTAVEAFVSCATELAETAADDEEQLVSRFDGGDLLLFESGPAHSFTLSFTR